MLLSWFIRSCSCWSWSRVLVSLSVSDGYLYTASVLHGSDHQGRPNVTASPSNVRTFAMAVAVERLLLLSHVAQQPHPAQQAPAAPRWSRPLWPLKHELRCAVAWRCTVSVSESSALAGSSAGHGWCRGRRPGVQRHAKCTRTCPDDCSTVMWVCNRGLALASRQLEHRSVACQRCLTT